MAALTTYFRHDEGRQRLLEQPHDIIPRDPARRGGRLAGAGQRARRLFGYYRADLRTAFDIAAPWWEATIAAQESLGLSRADAVRASFEKRAAGAASHPKLVWIVRSYWLKCGALTEGPAEDFVYPEEFLILWLEEAGEDELVRLICCMPYWPIGLDAQGNWC